MNLNPRYTIVVDRASDWKWEIDGLRILEADEYLTHWSRPKKRPIRIINLCRRYSYLSGGYYCSLLAEARNDLPMPTVADILDLSRRSLYAFALPELNQRLSNTMQRLAEPPESDFTLYIFFGQGSDSRFHRLANEIFDIFRYPLIKVRIGVNPNMVVKSITPLGLDKVVKDNLATFFEQSIRHYTRLPERRRSSRKHALYDLAILANPGEQLPPSDSDALKRFVKAGKALRMDVEIIQARDYHRISEFDGLFLRETTALDNHTFRFARKAEAEGLPVIDDSKSILRCTNKVYMWERLSNHQLPTPHTIPLNRAVFDDHVITMLEEQLGYPMVLKIPDGCFSRGMFKAANRGQVREAAASLFANSRLILAQEFMYTAYDWRIGILNGKPLFACKYKASKGHWQIVNHKDDGSVVAGGFQTLAVEDAPEHVVSLATKAAALIGNSLYGVDLKENDRGVYVIEINDNPNVDHGVEDKVLKGELYMEIMREFIRRIDASRL